LGSSFCFGDSTSYRYLQYTNNTTEHTFSNPWYHTSFFPPSPSSPLTPTSLQRALTQITSYITYLFYTQSTNLHPNITAPKKHHHQNKKTTTTAKNGHPRPAPPPSNNLRQTRPNLHSRDHDPHPLPGPRRGASEDHALGRLLQRPRYNAQPVGAPPDHNPRADRRARGSRRHRLLWW